MNRSGILNLMQWGTRPDIAARISYSDARPADIQPTQHELIARMAHPSPAIVIGWDCSGSIGWLFLHSGNKSPYGSLGFSGNGNTDTIATNPALSHYTDTRHAKTGALGIIGWPDVPLARQHAVVYMKADGQPDNPWVWSHGGDNGPSKQRLRDELSGFPGASFFWCAVGGL